MAAYSLILKNNRTNYHEGVAVDVHRDGVPVATCYEDPERTGGGRIYGKVSVSLQKIRWAGEMPDAVTDIPWSQRPRHLIFDFVCKTAQTASEALPEVIEHVEQLIEWRKSRKRAVEVPSMRATKQS